MSFNDDEMENIIKVVHQLAKIGLTTNPPPRYVTQIFRLALESSPSEEWLLQFVELSMAKLKWLLACAPLNNTYNFWTPQITQAWAQVFSFHHGCREKLSDAGVTAFPKMPDRSVFPERAAEHYQDIKTIYERVITGEMQGLDETEVYKPLQQALHAIHDAFSSIHFDSRWAFMKQTCQFFEIEPFWTFD
jgi:hypothetical protein